MTPHEQARAWREHNGWTRLTLSELIGYAPETIYWLERGCNPPGRGKGQKQPNQYTDIKPWVWLRYRRACQGVDAETRGVAFKW